MRHTGLESEPHTWPIGPHTNKECPVHVFEERPISVAEGRLHAENVLCFPAIMRGHLWSEEGVAVDNLWPNLEQSEGVKKTKCLARSFI